MDPKFNERCAEAIEELVRKHNLAAEELTESQLATVIKQIIVSGDLIKHVRVDNGGQQIVYVPYAETERLRSRIVELEAEVVRAWESGRSATYKKFIETFIPKAVNWDTNETD